MNAVCGLWVMALILSEFLVMAGSFAVIFAILLCGIHPESDRACGGRIARERARKLERIRRIRK